MPPGWGTSGMSYTGDAPGLTQDLLEVFHFSACLEMTLRLPGKEGRGASRLGISAYTDLPTT